MDRRKFLTWCSGLAIAALLLPKLAWAAVWNKPAFETTKLSEALQQLGARDIKQSQAIKLTAPDKAENGAIVQIEVISEIPNTESIAILVEKNPTPLIAHFKFAEGTESFVITRIKMAETSDITVLVKVGNQFFTQTKNVIVLENGCG
jgi:sulfur-oxidizing protein SoxY